MLVRIANREDPDQTASFWQEASIQSFSISSVARIYSQ